MHYMIAQLHILRPFCNDLRRKHKSPSMVLSLIPARMGLTCSTQVHNVYWEWEAGWADQVVQPAHSGMDPTTSPGAVHQELTWKTGTHRLCERRTPRRIGIFRGSGSAQTQKESRAWRAVISKIPSQNADPQVHLGDVNALGRR